VSKVTSTKLHLVVVVLVGTCASVGGFYAAKAATPSTSPLPLYYSGFLSQSGVAVNASHNVQIRLLDKATGGSPLVPDCSFGPAMIPVSGGHFSVSMSSGCEKALQVNRTAFVEVQVDGSVVGTDQQVGAAPFSYAAEQADQAVTISAPPSMEQDVFVRATMETTCTADPCAVTSQFGGVTSINRKALGSYQVNFASGTFSQPPSCVASTVSNAIAISALVRFATTTQVNVVLAPSQNSVADDGFTILCMGPR
jgi:hypothetical protein